MAGIDIHSHPVAIAAELYCTSDIQLARFNPVAIASIKSLRYIESVMVS